MSQTKLTSHTSQININNNSLVLSIQNQEVIKLSYKAIELEETINIIKKVCLNKKIDRILWYTEILDDEINDFIFNIANSINLNKGHYLHNVNLLKLFSGFHTKKIFNTKFTNDLRLELIEFLGFQLDCIQQKIKDAMEDM